MSQRIFIAFILLLTFIEIIINEDCPSIKNNTVENRNECFTDSTPDSYCCYKLPEKVCILVPKKELNTNLDVDCGISEENYGKYDFGQYYPNQLFDIGFKGCGKRAPRKENDCLDYSEVGNSCCYYKNKTSNEAACFSVGKSFEGKKQKNTYEFDGHQYEYVCSSFYLILNFSSIIIMFFLL